MRQFYTLLFFLTCTFLNAQIVNIPDPNFKNALIDEGVDTNNDGEIQVSEAEAVLNLNVNDRNISSLEGIQSFINLEELHCSSNQLSTLDMSLNINLKRLTCIFNELSNLNVTQNLNLIYLWCQDNQLSDLDVSQNLSLETLKCSYNPLSSVDVTQNVNLLRLDCGSNQLIELDVSQNLNLEFLSFDDNLLCSIDLTQNLSLEALTCRNNQLINLDLSQHVALEYLECAENQLTSLYINNGNNHNLQTMISTGNVSLTCIQVDDENATRPDCQGFPLEGWCKDSWTSYSEDCRLGITELKNLNLNLYPNPAQNELFITAQNTTENLKIKIFNIEGKLLSAQSITLQDQKAIDVSQLLNGIYFLNIEDENGNTTIKKFIKQ